MGERLLKALGMVFSARRRGNCHDCVGHCLQQLAKKGFDTRLIDFYDYNVTLCSNCDYECFSPRIRGTQEKCPKNDDMAKLYQEFEKAEVIVFGIPTYVGHVPALFRAWEERSLGIYGFGRFSQVLLNRVYGFIVVGSYSALSEALFRFHGLPNITWTLLRSREYGLDPLKTGLIGVSDVRARLNTLVENLAKMSEKKAQ